MGKSRKKSALARVSLGRGKGGGIPPQDTARLSSIADIFSI